MVQNTLIQVSVDDSLIKDADTLFADLGFDTPTAIRIFLKQAIKHKGLPFEVVQLDVSAEIIAATEEAARTRTEAGSNRYKDFSEFLADVQKNVIMHRSDF